MNLRTYLTLSGGIFGVVAGVHALRLVFRWPAHVGPLEAPLWVSAVAAVVAGMLAVSACRLRGRG